jgi:hypothetical protein
MPSTLRFGNKSPEVADLVKLLTRCGCTPRPPVTNGHSYNTLEGNRGNRVKIGRRDMGDPLLRGFINIIGDHPEFTPGSLRGAQNLGKQDTR